MGHRRTEVLGVCRHRAIRHVVVRRDTTQYRVAEATDRTLVLDEMALLQKHSGGVYNIRTLLYQARVIL